MTYTRRKTIVVEIDYMADPDRHHDHRPDDFGGPTGQPVAGLGVPDTTFNDNGHNQLAVGDVNGDGREEVLIANDSGGRIDVFDATTLSGAISVAQAAFADAPVPAAPNCPFPGADTAPGIQLIVDVNGTIPERPVFKVPADFTTTKADPNNFDPARDPYVHYNLWVHDYDSGNGVTGSSGVVKPGDDQQDFLVSLGGSAAETARPSSRPARSCTSWAIPSVDLTVIDRGSLSVVTTIPLATGQAAADVAVNSRTNRIYISNTSQGRIHVINGATNAELDPILIGPGPVGMTVDETTNTLYVAQNRRSEPIVTALGSVTDDGTNRQIHRRVELGPTNTEPVDVAVDPLNDRIYTANLGGGGVSPSVTVLDRRTRTIIKTINVPGSARAITVNPYAHQVFVAGDRGVDVIGEESLSVIRQIPADLPFAVTTAVGSGRQFYVGGRRSGELTRLSYSSGTRK